MSDNTKYKHDYDNSRNDFKRSSAIALEKKSDAWDEYDWVKRTPQTFKLAHYVANQGTDDAYADAKYLRENGRTLTRFHAEEIIRLSIAMYGFTGGMANAYTTGYQRALSSL